MEPGRSVSVILMNKNEKALVFVYKTRT